MSAAILVGWRADYQPLTLPGACSVFIPATRGTATPTVEIEAFYGESVGSVFADLVRKGDFAADPRDSRAVVVDTLATEYVLHRSTLPKYNTHRLRPPMDDKDDEMCRWDMIKDFYAERGGEFSGEQDMGVWH